MAMNLKCLVICSVLLMQSCSEKAQESKTDYSANDEEEKIANEGSVPDKAVNTDSSYVYLSAKLHPEDYQGLNLNFSDGRVVLKRNDFQDNGTYQISSDKLRLNLRSNGLVKFTFEFQDSILILRQNQQEILFKRTSKI